MKWLMAVQLAIGTGRSDVVNAEVFPDSLLDSQLNELPLEHLSGCGGLVLGT